MNEIFFQNICIFEVAVKKITPYYMFEIKGKYLRSRFYAQKIPAVSLYVYEMSRVSTSSIWYKTIPYPTRIISIQDDFFGDYNKRLQKYIRHAEAERLAVSSPAFIPDRRERAQEDADEQKNSAQPP